LPTIQNLFLFWRRNDDVRFVAIHRAFADSFHEGEITRAPERPVFLAIFHYGPGFGESDAVEFGRNGCGVGRVDIHRSRKRQSRQTQQQTAANKNLLMSSSFYL